MTHSEELSVTPLHKKIYRGVIVTGVVACALVAGIPLFIHSNVISSHSEALSQLGQRLQAIEMKMADSVTDDRMNAQLDVLRQGLTTLKQDVASQRDTLRTVTAQLAVAGSVCFWEKGFSGSKNTRNACWKPSVRKWSGMFSRRHITGWPGSLNSVLNPVFRRFAGFCKKTVG